MIKLIIPAIIMEFLMFGFSIYIFDNLSKRINNRVKKYFIDKLQDYNYLIEEKAKELENLRNLVDNENNKIKKLQETPESTFSKTIESKLKKMKKFKEGKIKLVEEEDIIYDIPTPAYREESFFKNYKELKKNFNVDTQNVLEKFVKEHKNTKQEDEAYKILTEFRSKFNQNTIYDCLTLNSNNQYNLMKEVMSSKEKNTINFEEKFMQDKKFTILKLLNYVDELIKKYDPTIYVYVGSDSVDYNYIEKNIKTYFYKNMSEGIIINYKGKMYDYSI